VIGEKTASLIAASTRLGALLSGMGPAAIATLAEYGWHLGMSLQPADDVLDIAGAANDSGKVPGTAPRERAQTRPVLLALEAAAARLEAAKAKRALHRAPVPDGPAIDGLIYLAEYAVDRVT